MGSILQPETCHQGPVLTEVSSDVIVFMKDVRHRFWLTGSSYIFSLWWLAKSETSLPNKWWSIAILLMILFVTLIRFCLDLRLGESDVNLWTGELTISSVNLCKVAFASIHCRAGQVLHRNMLQDAFRLLWKLITR